jgi:hypothetical protein
MNDNPLADLKPVMLAVVIQTLIDASNGDTDALDFLTDPERLGFEIMGGLGLMPDLELLHKITAAPLPAEHKNAWIEVRERMSSNGDK